MTMHGIGCFISPHGYGHATRTTAILHALQARIPQLQIHLFTTVPVELFSPYLNNLTYHRLHCDVGLSQPDALTVDLGHTITELAELIPFPRQQLNDLARLCSELSCILCDIAPLGIEVARTAAIPSVLIENFTWDWIYAPYIAECPDLERYACALKELFSHATHHIQTEPVCRPLHGVMTCPPIFRALSSSSEKVRARLDCGTRKIVLITMGGMDMDLPFLDSLSSYPDFQFIFTGQHQQSRVGENVLLLSRHSSFHHPDLINASDLVLCKSGYSTLAECYQAGVAVGCIQRKTFPESTVLEHFVTTELGGTILTQSDFLSGKWLDSMHTLLTATKRSPYPKNGADQVATFLQTLL